MNKYCCDKASVPLLKFEWCTDKSCFQIKKLHCEKGTRYTLHTTKHGGSQQFNEIYFGTSVFIRSILPVFGTVGTTGLLVKFLQGRKQANLTLTQQGQQAKQMDHLTICLVVIAICFLLFVFPYAVIIIIYYTNPTICSYYWALYAVGTLTMTNSSVNFGIYFWKLASFRRAIKKLFRGNKVSDVSTVGSASTAHTTQWHLAPARHWFLCSSLEWNVQLIGCSS